jgi:hypothetical protein
VLPKQQRRLLRGCGYSWRSEQEEGVATKVSLIGLAHAPWDEGRWLLIPSHFTGNGIPLQVASVGKEEQTTPA